MYIFLIRVQVSNVYSGRGSGAWCIDFLKTTILNMYTTDEVTCDH